MSTNSLPSRIKRTITGMSAVLLPHGEGGEIDWAAFEAHVARTREAGLVPAVNIDTGFVQLLGPEDRLKVLDLARSVAGDGFVGGAYVADEPGDELNLSAYLEAADQVVSRGGIPIIFPSNGLNSLSEAGWVEALASLGERLDRFIAFELGTMFVPYGRIFSLDAYAGLLQIPHCIGAKHSSLSRQMEWDRLALRNQTRPDFMVLTGNDLAIDMVTYGSDYLLGLSTFAPDLFARRDALWAAGDPAFYELNDTLQYLGHFAFRPPVPGYRHNTAMFLKLRGWAQSDRVPPGAPNRPDSDLSVLASIGESLGVL